MKSWSISFIAGFFATIIVANSASAYYSSYLPEPLLKGIQHLKQNRVKCNFEQNWYCEVLRGVTAKNVEGKFSLEGTDRSGKSWTIKEEESRFFGGNCYTADVDQNGTEDIIVLFRNGSVGYPFYAVVIYFFDQKGMCHREEAVSRFSFDNGGANETPGVEDLLLPSNGKSSAGSLLLIQDLIYGKSAGRDASYWRFSMMKAHDCMLTEVNSTPGVTYPCYVLFTKKPNHRASRSAQSRKHP